ncbi:MAG TPA: DEAD/DEAH box helicase [Thermoanaerobaculia bacterium]|nr:DEAD/DEAH box helicase [Thermoanaerobaculia bacterium]
MTEIPASTTNPFADLGLRAQLTDALTALGYEAPTPIQERTIPLLVSGRDLIGQAQTGTGKTAAFALPILEKIDPKKRDTQALVLTPTRELAMQVAEAIHSYAAKMDHVSVLPVYGGAPIVPQLKRLERGAHVVVGTPGRIIDHLDRGSLDLSKLRLIVLDEADEMLKMGFAEDVERILGSAPEERQTALFSATMPDEVLRIAKRHLRNPERVEIEHRSVAAPAIEQRFLNVSEGQKLEVLTQILELHPAEAVLIFRRTKTGAAELAEKLEARGFAAVAMHGDMTQPLRESVIRRLRAGQVEIVVATDVAARGLDVEQIEHVVNYDVPYDVEAYVHRIGRTGRAGRSGMATLFITPRERRMMREIERYTGMPIKPMKMPTKADLAAKRVNVFKDEVRKTIGEGELDLYLQLVEQLVEEGPFDIADIAAAAAKIASSGKGLPAQIPVTEADRETAANPASPSELPPPRENEKTVRLSMDVGREDGIRPADVVGSIANESGIPGRDIGPIEIRDDVTYVGVPERFVDLVIEKLGRKKFRGRALNLRVAKDAPPAERVKRAYDRDRERPPAPFRRDDKPAFRRDDKPPARRDDKPAYRRDAKPSFRRDEKPPFRRDEKPPFRRDDRAPRRDDDRPRGFAPRAGAGARPGGFSRDRDERPGKPFRPGSGGVKPRGKKK